MTKKNTWGAKVKRTLTCIMPVDKSRRGKCFRCGDCCKLPNICPFLEEKEGLAFCKAHKLRPFNCRKYPRTKEEHITSNCGHYFVEA